MAGPLTRAVSESLNGGAHVRTHLYEAPDPAPGLAGTADGTRNVAMGRDECVTLSSSHICPR